MKLSAGPAPALVALAALVASAAVRADTPQAGPPVFEVEATEVVDLKSVYATVRSRDLIQARVRTPGTVTSLKADEGDAVREGQVLALVVDPKIALKIKAIDARIVAAASRVETARVELDRSKTLLTQGVSPQSRVDQAQTAYDVAANDLKAAQARRVEARLNLDYTKVESPVAGVAGRAQRSEGSLVSGPEVLLTTVTQIDPIWVSFGIPDNEHIKLGNEAAAGRILLPKSGRFEVSLKLADGSVYARTGKLNFSDVRISAQTGTRESRAEIPNPDGKLRPGQFVRVVLQGAVRNNAIAVPQRAVLEGPQGKFVYVVNAEGKAEARPVTVGDWYGDEWLIDAGLKAGERVIVDGVLRIGPGAPVQVAPAAGAAEATSPAAKRPPQ